MLNRGMEEGAGSGSREQEGASQEQRLCLDGRCNTTTQLRGGV